MDSFYLICFSLGLVLSLLSVVGGFAHLHIGRIHIGHFGHSHAMHAAAQRGSGLSAVNGFTIMAFLCWFGGTGYLLHHFNIFVGPLVLLFAVLGGLTGATLLWTALFKILLPRERILTTEETEMTGVLAHVSDAIRDGNSMGEIIFSQTGTRHAAAARSEDGQPIARGTEVVVLRYERGIAHVRRFDDLSPSPESPPNGLP